MDNQTNTPVTETPAKSWDIRKCKPHKGGTCGGIYGLAFIGAAIYFLQNAHTFWAGVLGILKALVWPALLVYKLLEFLKV